MFIDREASFQKNERGNGNEMGVGAVPDDAVRERVG